MEQYADVVLDLEGNAIQGASVEVWAGSGNAQVDYKTPATVYDFNGKILPNSTVATGPLGDFAFSVPNGKYVIRVTVRGTVYKTIGPLTFYDPDDDATRFSSLSTNGYLSESNSFDMVPAVVSNIPSLNASFNAQAQSLLNRTTALKAKTDRAVSLKDTDAKSDVGGNQSPYFSQAITKAIAVKQGVVPIPIGTWRLTDEVTISERTGLLGEQSVATTLVFEGSGSYGIRVAGAGLGGSATDGIEIGNLNLQGGKDVALLGMQGTALFNLHDILAQNNTKGSVIRFTDSQDGVINHFDFLQCGGVGQSSFDGAVVYYGPGCNNIYCNYGRWEAPRNTAIVVDGANTVRYGGGKIDGSFGGANLTTNPFAVAKNGDFSVQNFTVTGFQATPFEIIGYGSINFSGVIGNGKADNLYRSTAASYALAVKSGGLAGVIFKPYIRHRGIIAFSSENTTGNKIGAIISLLAPDPLLKPNPGNSGRVQINSAFDTGGGLYQAAMKEWNGTAWVAPTTNDTYVGGWLVDSSTGNAFAQIVAQSGGLVQFRVNGLGSTGDEHFVQYDVYHGVQVDIQVDSPAYSQSRWAARLVELRTAVTTTGATYSNGYTTVTLSNSVPDGSLVGCFLYDKSRDSYYYISSNSGSSLNLMHDRTGAVVNGSYEVVVGNPKAGPGIKINWT